MIDQAVIAKRLSEEKAETGFTVSMPEISRQDFTTLINGTPQLTTALIIAEENNWISKKTAAKMFAFVIGQLGFEIKVEKELKRAKMGLSARDYEDYLKAFVTRLHGEMKVKKPSQQ
ncbi:MAG: hypothetical protein JRF50_12900 [Deltaproteobacteria bacterium]|nr:hypothetical protein [Deltaproteobacteria bacterium]